MSKLTLYSFYKSSSSWRVRIALALKNLDYEYKLIDLQSDEQYKEAYKKLNPIASVPTLMVGEHSLTQSISIMEYLDEVYPDIPLLPKNDPIKRADVRKLALLIVADVHPLQNLRVLNYLRDDKKFPHWVVKNGFDAFERELERSAGKYCYGNEITMADVCLVPQVMNARRRFHLNMNNYPLVSRIENTLNSNEAFLKAHPENQPDYPQGWIPS